MTIRCLFLYFIFSFYTNWLQLMVDDQGTDGTVTDVVPYIRYVWNLISLVDS
jgi:hypothetical protein